MSNKPKSKPANLRPTPPERRRFRRRILSWYDREKRELPWRGEKNPYRIWVSEAMLQQTRVDTVRRRYPAFIERFPTLASLADAPLDAVLAEWQGLGYYGRARNLHRAARQVVSGGAMPKTREALLALPGVGPYMAGAIASIAFGERCAAIDGNVLRIMSRVLNLSIPISSPPAQKSHRRGNTSADSARKARRFQPGADGLGRPYLPAQKPRLCDMPRARYVRRMRSRNPEHPAGENRQKTTCAGHRLSVPGGAKRVGSSDPKRKNRPFRRYVGVARLYGRRPPRESRPPPVESTLRKAPRAGLASGTRTRQNPENAHPQKDIVHRVSGRKISVGNRRKRIRTACCGRRRKTSARLPSPPPSGPRGARPKAHCSIWRENRANDETRAALSAS